MPTTFAPASGIFGRQMTRAAAEVEDPLARLGCQEIEQGGPMLPDERMLVVVEAGIPWARGGCVHRENPGRMTSR